MTGLRERKKQRTRLALIDAALDLFLTKGYDRTTVDEIVAAVQVSQRTFFRYFAAKEDAVLFFNTEYDALLVSELARRPATEHPREALIAAMRAVLATVKAGTEEQVTRFRRLRQITETTPTLVAAQLAQYARTEQLLVAELARRRGTDPADDLRVRLLVAFYMAAVRVGFADSAAREIFEPTAAIRLVEQAVEMGLSGLRDGWDRATPPAP